VAVLLGERVARAEEEALEIVAGGDAAGLDLHARAIAVAEHFDEGDEEVVHALTELLHVGVLVGRALVAVNGNALVDGAALEIELLAERLHDELLEVAREEEQAVLVGKHHHVLGAAAVGRPVPHGGEDGGGVVLEGRHAGDLVHRGGAGEHRVDVEALERGREQAHGAEFGGAAAHPVPHREAGDPAFLGGDLVELGAHASHGDKVLGVVETGGLEGGGGFEHAIARLDGATGLGDDDGERVGQLAGERGERVVDAVRVGVIEEVDRHAILPGLAQRVGDELRAERGAADADHEQVLELAARAGDGAGVDLGREILDGGERAGDLLRQLLRRSEVRGAQPIVADHAVLVGIGDGALFEGGHVGKGFLHRHLDLGEVTIGKRHAADVERQAERGIGEVVLFKTRPGHGVVGWSHQGGAVARALSKHRLAGDGSKLAGNYA